MARGLSRPWVVRPELTSATSAAADLRLRLLPPPAACRAKKRGPLQAVPVMARAIAERLRYVIPCQSKPSRTVVTVWRRP